MTELWRLGATELATALAAGETSPVELLDACLARVDALNPALNALVALDPRARRYAEDSAERLRRRRPRSALEGVPVTIKDNIPVEGLATTWGSRAFADNVADRDELAVARLRAAGAVLLGKTNVPEFTLEGYTDNPLFGTTRNPWDLRLTPGGSSGGAVAATASGIAPLAVGTDGGGSIRRPAGHTGLVGFKPSTGLIPRCHGLPQILLDFEVIGAVARCVEDAALLLEVMTGPDPRDRHSLLRAPTAEDAGALKILYLPRVGDAPLDGEIEHSVADAAARFESLGHRLIERPPSFDIGAVNTLWPDFGTVAVDFLLQRYPRAGALGAAKFVTMARRGATLSAARYLAMIEQVRLFRAAVGAAFEQIDVVLSPTAAALPWPAERTHPDRIDGSPVGPRGHAPYSAWVNACGYPAVSLPCAPSAAGLPIGLQLVGRFGADRQLLALARQYQVAAPWRERWPPFAFGA